MSTPLIYALALAAAPLAAEVDKAKLYEHIHKRYATPADMQITLKSLGPSPLPGLQRGVLELKKGDTTQQQEIHLTEDGRRYFLAPLYETRPDFGGLRVLVEAEGKPKPPPIYLSPDGRHALWGAFGEPQDLGVDPDRENLGKMRLEKAYGRGPKDAPVVLVEFSDLQCPFCKKAHEALEAELFKAYGKQVRWVSKHYPLRGRHPWAYDAAVAVSCAGAQKEPAYHALQGALFAAQESLTPANLRERALAFAREQKLDAERFAACFDKKEAAAAVEADIAEGDGLGVDSTPTLFVNGRRAPPLPFEALKPVIDEMLGAKK